MFGRLALLQRIDVFLYMLGCGFDFRSCPVYKAQVCLACVDFRDDGSKTAALRSTLEVRAGDFPLYEGLKRLPAFMECRDGRFSLLKIVR